MTLSPIRQLALDKGMRAVRRVGTAQQIAVAKAFIEYNEESRNWKMEVIWLWGASGADMSTKAREIAGERDTFIKSKGGKLWDGYDAHEVVIMDGFKSSWCPITEMIRLLDRYECSIGVKGGGTRQFKPKVVIITSIKHPKDCYKLKDDEYDDGIDY